MPCKGFLTCIIYFMRHLKDGSPALGPCPTPNVFGLQTPSEETQPRLANPYLDSVAT